MPAVPGDARAGSLGGGGLWQKRGQCRRGQPPPPPSLYSCLPPWDPRGAEECVCKFLCSDFPALPLAVTGSSRRARGASRPGGRSPCPAPGLLHAFSPLRPAPPSPAQLRAHWKGKARGGWLLGSLELCRTVLPADACLPPSCQFGSLLPAAPALPVLSICPARFGPADVGAGRYFPPRHLLRGWEKPCGAPGPGGHARAVRGSLSAPLGVQGPLRGAPPPACLCSGLSLTFSPSSALWIYFYLCRALLICPCYHLSLSPSTPPRLPALVPELLGKSGHIWGQAMGYRQPARGHFLPWAAPATACLSSWKGEGASPPSHCKCC